MRRLHFGFLVTVAVVALAAVVLAFVPLVGYVGVRLSPPSLDGARSATDRYLRAVEGGADDGAYGMLCASLRADVTPAGFTTAVDAAPRPRGHKVLTATATEEGNRAAEVTVRFDEPAGTGRVTGIGLRQDDGDWRVCGEPYI